MPGLRNSPVSLKRYPTLPKSCGSETSCQISFQMLGLRHTVTSLTGAERTLKQIYVNVESSCSMSFVKIDRARKSVELFRIFIVDYH